MACGQTIAPIYAVENRCASRRDAREPAPGACVVVPDAVPAITYESPRRPPVMRKGGCIPELNKFWVVQSCLKVLDSLPLCHINKAEPGVGHQTPMEPSRHIAGLPLHKGFGGFPLCQKLFVLALGHFKGIDEDHRWHGYAPSYPSMVRLDAPGSPEAHAE